MLIAGNAKVARLHRDFERLAELRAISLVTHEAARAAGTNDTDDARAVERAHQIDQGRQDGCIVVSVSSAQCLPDGLTFAIQMCS